jgi:hypothetical protein
MPGAFAKGTCAIPNLGWSLLFRVGNGSKQQHYNEGKSEHYDLLLSGHDYSRANGQAKPGGGHLHWLYRFKIASSSPCRGAEESLGFLVDYVRVYDLVEKK